MDKGIIIVSKTKREANYKMPEMHMHDYHEMLYVFSGHCNIFVNKELYDVPPGYIIILPAGYIHKTTYTDKSATTRFVIRFTQKDLELLADKIGMDKIDEIMSQTVHIIPEQRREYVERIMDLMKYENDLQDDLSASFNDIHFQELMLFLIRSSQQDDDILEKVVIENNIIKEVADYIYLNYDKPITLDDMAYKFNVSRSYLSKKFKSVTGVGFKAYLISVRIQAACTRLLESDDSITQIAIECGFNDSNYFGDAFRHCKGMSPAKYRKSNVGI